MTFEHISYQIFPLIMGSITGAPPHYVEGLNIYCLRMRLCLGMGSLLMKLIGMKSCWSRLGSSFNMTDILIR